MGAMLALLGPCSASTQVGVDPAAQSDEERNRRARYGGGDAHEGTSPDRRREPVASGAGRRRWHTRPTRSVNGGNSRTSLAGAAMLRKHEMTYPHWYPAGPGREQGIQGGLTERVTLRVQGVVSESLCASVCSALRFISGVAGVVVDRAASEVTLRYDPHRARIEQFRIAVWAMGCRVERLTFPDEHQGWHALRNGQNVPTAPPPPRRSRRVSWQGGPALGVLRTRRTRTASTGMASIGRMATSRPSVRREAHPASIPPSGAARARCTSGHGSSRSD